MGQKILSNKEELKMIEEYKQGVPVNILMSKYGYATKKSITDKIKKHYGDQYEEILLKGFQARKGYSYSIPQISSEFDAYFIGLLLTDGYVCSDREAIGIDLTDEDCISFLSMRINKPYKKYASTRENSQDRYRLIIQDKDLVKSLERFGVVRRKILELQPP